MWKWSGKNRSENARNTVIFECKNGKENTKDPSIYRFFAGQIQAVGLKEMDGRDQVLRNTGSECEIWILFTFPQSVIAGYGMQEYEKY